MNKFMIVFLLLFVFSPLKASSKQVFSKEAMKQSFEIYYSQLIEAEEHYYQSAFSMKMEFAKEQEDFRGNLLVNTKEIYNKLIFGDQVENKMLLGQLREMRGLFNKNQREKREIFKKKIFMKKQQFEDLRLKRKSDFEIAMRKWRAKQNQINL